MTESADELFQKANGLLAAGQPPAARAVLDVLVAQQPGHVRAHLMLGSIAWQDNRRHDANRHAIDAARVAPLEGSPLVDVVVALVQIGESMLAMEILQRPFFAQTQDGGLLVRAAELHQALENHPEALALYERAHAAGIDGPEYRFNHALQLTFNGRLREAEAEFEQSIGMGGATQGTVYVNLARLRRQTRERNHLRSLQKMIDVVPPGSEDLAALEFARYKELEDLGLHDQAWTALARGNALMAARMPYEAARRERLLEGVRNLCSADFVRPERAVHEGAMPIFVIGMTRSGTTVLDRVLGNHSQVVSAGEIRDFGMQLSHVAGQCSARVLDGRILGALPKVDFAEVGTHYLAQSQWRARDRRYFIDKFPPNWQVAGLIRRALPQAKILHLVRDPMDVCFSNFRAFFGQSYAWSYDLGSLAHYYHQYRRTMAHWHAVMPGQILDVHYSDLVRHPEESAREVFEFCGLDYEDGCIDLTRNQASVASWSMAQVREAIHTDAFKEWRPYSAQLAGLHAAVAGR